MYDILLCYALSVLNCGLNLSKTVGEIIFLISYIDINSSLILLELMGRAVGNLIVLNATYCYDKLYLCHFNNVEAFGE